MKSDKGITLISLTIYVIVFAILIGVIASISGMFYSNVKNINEAIDPINEYAKFNSFFVQDINSNTKIEEISNDYVVFKNVDYTVQYQFIEENKSIYRDQVKICSGIDECVFVNEIKNGKDTVTVFLKAGKQDRTTSYTIGD